MKQDNLLVDAVSTAIKTVDFSNLNVTNPLVKYSTDNVEHTIKEFLGRPQICPAGSIVWTTAQVQNTDLMTMNIPSAMTATSLFADKLDGFLGFKATMVLKVQSNAQKFASGILLISVLPVASHISTTRQTLIASSIALKTQLPSVRMNIAETDEVEIKVPFISPELFYNRTSPIDWARVFVTVYAQSTGDSIPITCWCHFEDVELFYPTAQSSLSVKAKNKKQMYTPGDQEDAGGMISAPLSTFSRAFGQVANNIPLLSSVARPTEWFLAACSKAFNAFGFSNVVDTSTRHSFVRRIFSHPNNIDVNDTCDSHGLFASNKVAHLPGFAGSDIDEMSLQYVCSVPSYIETVSWTNVRVSGAILSTYAITPAVGYVSKTTVPSAGPAVTSFIYPPMFYVASSFSLWRGSITLRFFLSKTEFHTGRILFVFNPSVSGATPPTFNTNSYNYKWIWDIRDSHSYEVTIPYVSSVPWTPVNTSATGSIGQLTAFVLNPLTAPPTVSTSVTLLVEAKAGHDFKVCRPTTNSPLAPIMAYSDLNPSEKNRKFSHRQRYREEKPVKSKKDKKSYSRARDLKYAILAQGPLTVEDNSTSSHIDSSSKFEFGHSSHDFDGYNEMFTIGETVNSLRQLLKRSQILVGFANSNPYTVLRLGPMNPYIPTAINAAAPVAMPTADYIDYLSKFSMMYGLRRGGVIIRTTVTGTGNSYITSTLENIGNNISGLFEDVSGTKGDNYSNTPNQIYSSNTIQGAVDTLVPYYNPTHASPVLNITSFTATSGAGRYYIDDLQLRLSFNLDAAGPTSYRVYRQAADDFSLGCFIGVLPLSNQPKSYA